MEATPTDLQQQQTWRNLIPLKENQSGIVAYRAFQAVGTHLTSNLNQ